MKCPNCGSPVKDNFCPECGALVAGYASKKGIRNKWWFWALISLTAVTVIFIFLPKGKEQDREPKTTLSKGTTTEISGNTLTTGAQETITEEQYNYMVKVYDLSPGIYTAGTDLPAGRCNIAAISGKGNLYSSNLEGGINELFGIDYGKGTLKESFLGLELPEYSSLTVSGNLKIRLFFTAVKSGYTGRNYDETDAVTLGGGKYTAGTDFSPGTFKVTAESGSGTVLSSNSLGNGINEILGKDDGSSTFSDSFLNVDLPVGTELTISEGLTVKLIPAV